MISVWKTK